LPAGGEAARRQSAPVSPRHSAAKKYRLDLDLKFYLNGK